MEVQRVIYSLNDQPAYRDFWEVSAKHNWNKFGLKSAVAYLGDSQDLFESDYADVIRLEPNKNIPIKDTAWQCTWAFFYLAKYFPKDTCMILGIDQILLNTMMIDSVQGYDDSYYAMLITDAYNGASNVSWLDDSNGVFAASAYHVAKGSTFCKVYDFDDVFADEVLKLYCSDLASLCGGGPFPLWGIDERYSTQKLRDYHYAGNVVMSPGFFHNTLSPRRLDRAGNVKDINRSVLDKITKGYYAEYHGHRPYRAYKKYYEKVMSACPVYHNKFYAHHSTVIDPGCDIGTGTKIWVNSHIRENAKIGNNCSIGDCVYVDDGVVIGNNCRIQNGSQIYKGVTLEDDVFIGPCVTTTNDLYPRVNNENFVPEKTLIKKGASIGANSTILAGITIGENAMIGCGSVVVTDVPDGDVVLGNPASTEYKK